MTMKSYLTTLAALVLLSFNSCKKDKGTERDYAKLNQLSQNVTLASLDSAKAVALYNLVATERTNLLNKLEQLHPGLKSQMDYDIQQIVQTEDSTTRALLIDDFKTSYFNQVKQAWDATGLSVAALTSKYQQVLGNIPFTVGTFGEIVTVASAEAATYGQGFPDDSVTTFIGTPFVENESNCGGITSPSTINNPTLTQTRLFTTFAGGCSYTSKGMAKVTVPGSSGYQHVYARFDIGSLSYVDCFAGAVAGASVSGARVKVQMVRGLTTVASRELVSISVVAPLIWFAGDHRDLAGSTTLEIAYPVGSQYNGEIIAEILTENWVSTGGVATGTHSISQIYKNNTVFRMVK